MSEGNMEAASETQGTDTSSIGSLDWWKQRLTEIVDGDAAFQKAMREELRNAGDNTPDPSGSFGC